jgi:hypothetical protein
MTPAEMAQADQILAHAAEHVSRLVNTAREMRDDGIGYEESIAVMCAGAIDADVTRDGLALALAVAVVRLAQQEVTT